jgi:streptogramin lyase
MRGIVAVVAGTTALMGASSALAEPHVELHSKMEGVTANSKLVAGPDGNIWAAVTNAVARVTPDGTVLELTATDSDKIGAPEGGIAAADGAIWVSQPPVGVQSILKITPGDPPTVESFAVTDIDAGSPAMTLGPDGNVWVAINGKIVKFPPSEPTNSTPYTFTGLQPKCMAASPDGTLWVSDANNGGQLLNVKTDGTPAHDPYPTGGVPQCLAAGANGKVTVALPTNTPQQIGQLTPGGTLTTIDRPIPADPFGVAFGADGAFWVGMFAGNRLDRVTPDGQLTSLTGFPDVPNEGPRQVTAGPNNTLWVTLEVPGSPEKSEIAKVSGVEVPTGGGGGGGGGGNNPPPPPPDTTAPTLTGAKLAKTRVPVGTASITLRFTVNEAGTATIAISKRLKGRRSGGRCVKPTRKLRRAKRCTRLARVKTVHVTTIAGANSVKLRIKTLKRGSYAVALTAADAAGNRTKSPVTRTLTIAKKRR